MNLLFPESFDGGKSLHAIRERLYFLRPLHGLYELTFEHLLRRVELDYLTYPIGIRFVRGRRNQADNLRPGNINAVFVRNFCHRRMHFAHRSLLEVGNVHAHLEDGR